MATLVVRDRKGNTVARLDVSPSRPVHAGRTAENEPASGTLAVGSADA